MSNEMQPKPTLHGATSISTWSHIWYTSSAGAPLFRSVTNLPFLSLGELRKNGTWAEATLLPLRDACGTERKERGAQENRDAECEAHKGQGSTSSSEHLMTLKSQQCN